jgi:hypothetical protein
MDRPAAGNAVQHAARTSEQSFTAADRQLVNPVQFEYLDNSQGRHRPFLRHAPAAANVFEAFAERVVGIEQQPALEKRRRTSRLAPL